MEGVLAIGGDDWIKGSREVTNLKAVKAHPFASRILHPPENLTDRRALCNSPVNNALNSLDSQAAHASMHVSHCSHLMTPFLGGNSGRDASIIHQALQQCTKVHP